MRSQELASCVGSQGQVCYVRRWGRLGQVGVLVHQEQAGVLVNQEQDGVLVHQGQAWILGQQVCEGVGQHPEDVLHQLF